MTSDEKRSLRSAAGEVLPGARAGLSTYFLAASVNVLSRCDSLCMLLPSNWLEADYAAPVRQHLWEMRRRRIELHIFPNHLNLFPGASVSAMILNVLPETSGDQPLVIYRVVDSSDGGYYRLTSTELSRNGRMPRALTVNNLHRPLSPLRVSQHSSTKLGEVAIIRRGVATGANSFFVRDDKNVQGIPPTALVPTIGRLRDLAGNRFDKAAHEALGEAGRPRWLLRLDDETSQDPIVQGLLFRAEQEGYNERHLCKNRRVWYILEKMPPPDLLIGPMSKDRFRVVINDVKGIPTNTLYGITLKNVSSADVRIKALAEWLRSPEGQSALRTRARQHGDGLLKIEPGALARVALPSQLAKLLIDGENTEGPTQ